MRPSSEPVELALVGVGPTASSLLERLAANVDELLPDTPLRVHLVDPHRAGTGRVWRPDLHPLLWMNSLAEDVTMFTDASVRCSGPIRPGPSLIEWARTLPDDELASVADDPSLRAEIRALTGDSFPTRRVQSAYLEWFHRRALAALPPSVEVVVHAASAVDLTDGPDGRQHLTLDGRSEPMAVDAVVFALGHLDAEPTPAEAAHADFARRHGLAYLPPGHTAEQDLDVLGAGIDVAVLGFGQAFTDLLVLVTEGRGGRFVERPDGWLSYEPSGREPILHVGSRRGVPYRSKPAYRLQAPLAPLPRFLDDAHIQALLDRGGPIEFFADVLPLLAREAGWGYYHELFHAHPDRTATTWDDFAARYAAAADGDELDAVVADAVPAADDRFSIARIDRPLAGVRLDSVDDLQRWMHGHIAGDVARRTDPACSADLGAFMAMLLSFGPLGRISASKRLTRRSKVDGVNGWWFSFFMYYASGPPPARLRQCLALAEAGLLHFVGADMTVEADDGRGRFVARSATHPDAVVCDALVDARIATPSVSRSAQPLLRRLHERGELCEEVVVDGDWSANTGKVLVAGDDLRLVGADRAGHPRRHALGVFTSRPAAGAFARPRTNAPAFRQNDAVARSLLTTLAAVAAERAEDVAGRPT